MQLNCPACGTDLDLLVLIQHESARSALIDALSLSQPLGKLLIQYLSLFKPPKRALTMDRVAALLGELVGQIKSAQIDRNGRVWPAPMAAWIAALEQMLGSRDRLTLPLKSHGYLYEILVSAANKQEAQAEMKVEAQRAQRSGVGVTEERKTTRSVPPAAFKDLLKGMKQ